jgi:hypothetical protein
MGARIVSDNTARVRAGLLKKVDAVLGDAAREVETRAKTKAPVFLRPAVKAKRRAPLWWQVGVYDPRARFIELGTTRTRAQPFLLPAFMAVSKFLKAALKRVGV